MGDLDHAIALTRQAQGVLSQTPQLLDMAQKLEEANQLLAQISGNVMRSRIAMLRESAEKLREVYANLMMVHRQLDDDTNALNALGQ